MIEISGTIKIDEDTEMCSLLVGDLALVDSLEDLINKRFVSVRYWICPEPMTKEQANENFLKTLLGVCKAEWEAQYSEITGYLWTDEDLIIGGHDLKQELESHVGKYLILEIEVH